MVDWVFCEVETYLLNTLHEFPTSAPVLISVYMLLLPKGQTAEGWQPSNQ